MRDNTLARGLIARGHKAHLVPMYLPLQLDEERVDEATPVFFWRDQCLSAAEVSFFS
jgi:hypothetical protein